MEYTSPVVRGLMNGFSLGNMLQQQQMDKRRLDMQEQQQGFDNQSRQVTLLSQLAEMGARPVTQSDQYEADGGQHVNGLFCRLQGSETSGRPDKPSGRYWTATGRQPRRTRRR